MQALHSNRGLLWSSFTDARFPAYAGLAVMVACFLGYPNWKPRLVRHARHQEQCGGAISIQLELGSLQFNPLSVSGDIPRQLPRSGAHACPKVEQRLGTSSQLAGTDVLNRLCISIQSCSWRPVARPLILPLVSLKYLRFINSRFERAAISRCDWTGDALSTKHYCKFRLFREVSTHSCSRTLRPRFSQMLRRQLHER